MKKRQIILIIPFMMLAGHGSNSVTVLSNARNKRVKLTMKAVVKK